MRLDPTDGAQRLCRALSQPEELSGVARAVAAEKEEWDVCQRMPFGAWGVIVGNCAGEASHHMCRYDRRRRRSRPCAASALRTTAQAVCPGGRGAVAWTIEGAGDRPAREGEWAVDTTTLIWIIVGIVIVLVIVVVALLVTARGRRARRQEQQHQRAEKLRADARETELQARQHEAEAARARADAAAASAAAEAAKARAAEASIDAERRAGTIDDHSGEADKLRQRQAETLRKADDVDPYVGDDGRPNAATAVDADDRTTTRDANTVDDRRTVRDADTVDDRSAAHDANGVGDRANVRDTNTVDDHDTVAGDPITRPPAPPTRADRT